MARDPHSGETGSDFLKRSASRRGVLKGLVTPLAAACAQPPAPSPTTPPKPTEAPKPAAAPTGVGGAAVVKPAEASKPAAPTTAPVVAATAAPVSKSAQAGGKATWAISGDPTCLAPFGILP